MKAEELFDKYTNFAYKIAHRYSNYDKETEDIKQQALTGLWIASKEFDESKGFPFMSFASVVINNQILMYLKKIKRHMGAVSANKEVAENIELLEIIPDTHYLEDKESELECNLILKEIKNERTRYIFAQLAIGRSQTDIADELGVSRYFVSQIKCMEAKKLQQKRGATNNAK